MATDQEKQELVDRIKDPRFYRILIRGYGGESTYCSISRSAFEFWNSLVEEHGDGDLVEYMLNSEDGEWEFDEIDEVPKSAQFMIDEDGDARPWYEPPNEIDHSFGVTYESALISVEEVDSFDYNADFLNEASEEEDLTDLVDKVYEESEVEIQEYNFSEPDDDVDYIAQLYSIEKGTFFSGTVDTHGDFDPSKLKISITEGLNGEENITEVRYDGVFVENDGGDTNGKGYVAAVWAT